MSRVLLRTAAVLGAALLVWAGAGGAAYAQPDSLDAQFEAANRAYEQGRHEEALETYQSIRASGYASPMLYYNMGNAAFRAGRVGEAIRYYETARRRRPDDPRIRHNLRQARQRAGISGGTRPFWKRAVEGWSAGWLWGSGGLLIAGACAWIAGRVLRGSGDAVRWRAALAAAGLGALLVGVGAGVSYLQASDTRAVVVAESVALQDGPTPEARTDTTLPEGLIVEVEDARGAWTGIRLPDGTTGWVQQRSIGRIE